MKDFLWGLKYVVLVVGAFTIAVRILEWREKSKAS
jgi:hypothetical protein